MKTVLALTVALMLSQMTFAEPPSHGGFNGGPGGPRGGGNFPGTGGSHGGFNGGSNGGFNGGGRHSGRWSHRWNNHNSDLPFSVIQKLRAIDESLEDIMEEPMTESQKARVIRELEDLKRDIIAAQEELAKPPLSASCVGKWGGNFFNPLTHVECTFRGAKGMGYEVSFQGQRGNATAVGTITENNQAIASDKVKVGGPANFVVYVIQNGQRVEVARGQAQR